MTIRRHIDIAAINIDYGYFLDATEKAPEGVFEQAKKIAEFIGDHATEFLAAGMDVQRLAVDNGDGIREIECLMFDMLRRKNPNSEIEEAMGLGRVLAAAPHDPSGLSGSKQWIITGLTRDRDFLRSVRIAATPVEELTGSDLIEAAIGGGHGA